MLTSEWKLEDAIKIRCEETEARTTRKIVNHMHKEGYSVAEILKITGLPEKGVKKALGMK